MANSNPSRGDFRGGEFGGVLGGGVIMDEYTHDCLPYTTDRQIPDEPREVVNADS